MCEAWCCPKSVARVCEPFDPCEAERRVLNGQYVLPWIGRCALLHLSSSSCIAKIPRGHMEIALFRTSMRVRNANSHGFLIKLTLENGT
jgi:hypothetical protein